MNSLQLFLNQIQSAPEQLKTSVLHVLFDILMVHEEELLGSQAVVRCLFPCGDITTLWTLTMHVH